jgi:hypothetical protein
MLALMQAYLLWIEFLLKGKICLERYKVSFFYRDVLLFILLGKQIENKIRNKKLFFPRD